jgi:hypothetical protein
MSWRLMHLWSIFKTLICHFLFGVINLWYIMHILWRFMIGFFIIWSTAKNKCFKVPIKFSFFLSKKDILMSKIYIIWLVILPDNIRNFIFFGISIFRTSPKLQKTTYINDIQVVILSVFIIISFLIFTYLLRKLSDHMTELFE